MNDEENRPMKLTLPFINKGKPFLPPTWTCNLHEAALSKLIAYTKGKKLSEADIERELKYLIIHESLLKVDPRVELSKIKKMNAQDVTLLFDEIYNSGRLGIYFREPEPEEKEKPKSTGKKN